MLALIADWAVQQILAEKGLEGLLVKDRRGNEFLVAKVTAQLDRRG